MISIHPKTAVCIAVASAAMLVAAVLIGYMIGKDNKRGFVGCVNGVLTVKGIEFREVTREQFIRANSHISCPEV